MMDFDRDAPLYLQIADNIRRQIISGRWPRGEKVLSVRDLALQMQVNPNTMQKAMVLLEEEGLLYAERTSGRYVTKDNAMIVRAKQMLTNKEIERFFTSLRDIGYRDEEIPALLQNRASFDTLSDAAGSGKTE